MSSGGNSIGDFFVNLFFKVDDKSKNDAEKLVDGLKDKFLELGKAALAFNEIREAVHHLLAPLHNAYEAVAQIAEHGDALNNFATTIGVTTQQLEKMQFVAHLADVEMGTMNFALSMLSRQMGEIASGGGKEVSHALQKLGVHAKDAHGNLRNVGEVMPELIQKFASMKDANERMNLAQDIFGRGARQLMPLLTKQAEEIAEMNKQFDALGGAYSKELIERSAQFSDNVKLGNFAFNNMKRDLATGIIPELTKFFDIWINWAKLHWPDISKTLTSLGHTIGEVFMKTAGTAFDSFLKYIADVYKNRDKLEEMVPTIKKLALALSVLFAVMNPGKTVTMLAMFALEDFLGAMEGKDSVVGRLALSFKEFFDEFKKGHAWFQKLLDVYEKFMVYAGARGTRTITGQGTEGSEAPEDGLIDQLAFQQKNIKKAQEYDAKVLERVALREKSQQAGETKNSKKTVNNVQHVHNYNFKETQDKRELVNEFANTARRIFGEQVNGSADDLATEGD